MKEGDMIIGIGATDDNNEMIGVKGVIIKVFKNDYYDYKVKFDKKVTSEGLHNDEEGKTYNVKAEHIKLVNKKMSKLKEKMTKWT